MSKPLVTKNQFLQGMAIAYDQLTAARGETIIYLFEAKTTTGINLGFLMGVRITTNEVELERLSTERSKVIQEKPSGSV